MLEVGLRVVRGADWKWADQDGGDGHAGTVVEIGKPPILGTAGTNTNHTDKTPDKTVIVQWDHGSRSNYRIGYQDAYDLLVFDNAAAGVKHSNIICDGCKIHGIIGIRWKCSQCFDYDLCTQCYMSDTHDLTHTFQRFLTSNSVGVKLTSRENCTKVPLKGIFIGAKVTRGPDWEWGNQDGGRGKTGRVIDIRGWDNESSRSVATVTWTCGNTNVYRLGYKGCVDLCYVEEATTGTYYKEHLPLLGQPSPTVAIESNSSNSQNNSNPPSPSHTTFVVGDKVKVLIEIDTLKGMQAGHGGWNPRMADYIGKIGTVHRITDKGDIRVQYEGCNNRWTFHPGALTKIISKENFAAGDIVKIKSDASAVKHYQRGHGEWIDAMKAALGKTGKVIKIYPDGDMRVQIGGHTWTFSPLSVNKVPPGSEAANSFAEANRANENTDVEVEKLLRDAARGKAGIPAVKEFLRKYPHRVDARGGPGGGRKTCLQVAAHQGQKELCILLLDADASLYAVDEDGDTPLHYAAFGNQPEIVELLLGRGAAIDVVNNGKCSALHVAVNKQHVECVKTLLRHGCNVNLQDSYGDTTLHDAICKDSLEIIEALCSCDRIDFTLRNNRGFNVLHHAALKGNAYAMQRLVQRARQLVDVKKDDGFAALHLAALNGHREVAVTLLSANGGRARIDLQNNRRQTPLHLATSQGHWSLVELLVNHNADIASTDEDGETTVHIAISKSRYQADATVSPENSRDSPQLFAIWEELVRQGARTELTLACFLLNNDTSGTILEQVRNSKGKTPLDLLLGDPLLASSVDLVRSYQESRRSPSERQVVPSSSETPIYEIETVARADSNNETPRKVPPTSRGSVDCIGCQQQQQQQQQQPGAATNPAANQENRLGSGAAVGCTSCAQCACTFAKSQMHQDSQLNREELEKEVQREKAKNGFSEKSDKTNREKDKDLERLRYLETRIADLEEANMCSICMERRRNVAFLCGHGACEHCAAPLKTCHMCRQPITKKINLY